MPRKYRFWRRLARVLTVIGLLLIAGITYLLIVSITRPPKIADKAAIGWERTESSNGFLHIEK